MATIEERASSFAAGFAGATHIKHGYVRGAKEQQGIDINKAVKWLRDELSTEETTDPRYPTDVVSRSYYTAEELIEAFSNYMKGGDE